MSRIVNGPAAKAQPLRKTWTLRYCFVTMLRDFPTVPARPFGPDSSPAEIQAIKSRIYMIEPGIFLWHEIPIQTPFSVRLHAETLNELAASLPSFKYIVDLREAQTPSQEVRATLIESLNHGMPRLSAVAAWTGRNFLLNVASKFVIAGFMGLKKRCYIGKTLEDCVQALRTM